MGRVAPVRGRTVLGTPVIGPAPRLGWAGLGWRNQLQTRLDAARGTRDRVHSPLEAVLAGGPGRPPIRCSPGPDG